MTQNPQGYKAFIAESGIHDGASVCVVAGYVGSLGEWRRFERAWGPHASAPGFHSKEFFARDNTGTRVGPYRGWDDVRARRYFSTLLNTVLGLKLYPIGALVDVRAFQKYTEDERRIMTGGKLTPRGKWAQTGAPSKPYFLAFWKAVTRATEITDRKDWNIDFVFDQQNQYESLALQTFKGLKADLDEDYTSRLGSAVFASRRDAIALQAADMLAHAWHQFGTVGHDARLETHAVLALGRDRTLVAFTEDFMDKPVGRAAPTPGATHVYDPTTREFRPETT